MRGTREIRAFLAVAIAVAFAARSEAFVDGVLAGNGDKITAAIGIVGDTDSFTVGAGAGGKISVTVAAAKGSLVLPTLQLIDPAGIEATVVLKGAGGKKVSFKNFLVPAGGTGEWTVIVGGGATSGSYAASFKVADPKTVVRKAIVVPAGQEVVVAVPTAAGTTLTGKVKVIAGTAPETALFRADAAAGGGTALVLPSFTAARAFAVDVPVESRTRQVSAVVLAKAGGGGDATVDLVVKLKSPKVLKRVVTLPPEGRIFTVAPAFVRQEDEIVLAVGGVILGGEPAPRMILALPEGVTQDPSLVLDSIAFTGFPIPDPDSGEDSFPGASIRVKVAADSPYGTRDILYSPHPLLGEPSAVSGVITVLAPLPVVTSVTPAMLRQEEAGTVLTVTGAGFRQGGVLSLSGTGIGLGATTVVDATTATVTVVSVDADATVGPRDVSFTQPVEGGGVKRSGTGLLSVLHPVPVITSSTPSTVKQEASGVLLTVTGSGFRQGGTLVVSGTGVSLSGLTVNNPTTVTATMAVTPAAAEGLRSITWTQPVAGGGEAATGTDLLRVNFPDPTVTLLSPSILRQTSAGTTLTLTGTGFRAGGTITIAGTGLSVGTTTVVGATSATVVVSVDVDAPIGARNVTFTQAASGGGASAGLPSALTILYPVPTVFSFTPSFVRQEEVGKVVTVTGAGFRPGGVLSISGTGITFGATTINSETEAEFTLDVAADATPGNRTVTYTHAAAGGGDIATKLFPVRFPVCSVTSVSPGFVRQEDTGAVITVTGTKFRSGGGLGIAGNGISFSSTTFVNETTATITLVSVAAGADVGLKTVTWTQPSVGGGESAALANSLGVRYPVPSFTSVTPGIVRQQDNAVTVTVRGTKFRNTIGLSMSGTGWTKRGSTFTDVTNMALTMDLDAAAAIGPRDLTYTTDSLGGGETYTLSNAVAVEYPVPAIGDASPTSVTQGDSGVTLSFFGSRFRTGGTLGAGAGITVTNSVYDTDNSVHCTIDVDLQATLGPRDLTYTQALIGGGATGTRFNGLQVNAPNPTVTAIDVATVRQGDSAVARFITGTNFRSGGTLTLTGTNVTVGSVVVTSATRVDFDLTATSSASIGTRDVTWTQPAVGGGAAATLTSGLTVNYPDPTITTVSPSFIEAGGAAQTLTLTGTNFRTGGTISVSGADVTLSSPTFVSATSFTVVASASASAAVGLRNVTYTHSGGGGASFTKPSSLEIKPFGIDLTSMAPFAWLPGTSRFRCVVIGTNFNSGTSVSVSGSGVTVHSTTVDSATQLTLELSVASNASLGSRNVTITPGSGGPSAKTFNGAALVAAAAPAIGSFSAPTLAQGASGFAVTILGAGFRSGDAVSASGSGVTFASVTIVNEGKITATASVTGGASTGSRDLSVTHAASDGALAGTLTAAFKVVGAAPTLTAVNPSKVGRTGSGGATREVPITLTGTNFMTGATLSVSKSSSSGVSVVSSSEAVVSDTQMTATLSITGTATTGAWDLQVANPSSLGNSGSGGAGLLDVKDENTLCVHRVNAASGTAFGGERVTITGSGFVAGAVVDFGTVRAAGTLVLDKCTLVTTVPVPSAQSASASRVVDVKVTNPSTSNATLTGGYSYAKDDGLFRVVSIFPAQGATNVPKNLVSPVIRLSYPADTSSGTYANSTASVCWFESGVAFVTNGFRSFGPDTRLLVLSRTGGGNLGTTNGTYILNIAVTLKSLGGNALSPQRTSSLTTDQYSFSLSSSTTDATAPTLSSIAPANAATGVDLGTKVKIVLSEEIDPLTVNATNITFKQGGTTIPADVTLGFDLRTITITPHATLSASLVYTTNVTASVKDLFGNAYANTSYTFTTGTGTDATAPLFDAAILEGVPSDMDGSGTFVNASGTGGNAFDLYLPRDGWLVDVRFSDEGAGIDVSTFSAKASVAVGGASANAELASNFTITPTGATWRIPSSGFAVADDDTFTFNVKDLAGNAATAKVVTFDVVSKDSTATGGGGGDLDPHDARRTWILRGDIDAYTATYSTATGPNQQGATTTVASSGVPDLDEALRLIGLNSASMTAAAAATVRGNDTGTNAIVKRLFLERFRELMRVRYGISEDGVHGADSVDVEFLLAGEQGSLGSMPTYGSSNSSASGAAFSEMSIGGTVGADGSAFTAAGTLGQAWLDPRNRTEQANLNFGVGGATTGIYLMGMMKLQVNNGTTNSLFGSRISAKFVAIHGGTPAGENSLDDDVLSGSFDRTAGGNSAAMNTRYDAILDAVELVALYTSAVAAHEVGHSTGLVPDGAPKTGLFGNAHFNNTFTEATSTNPNTSGHLDFLGNDIMAASTSFESGVTTGADFKRFSPMDAAYLRNRLVHDEGK